MHGNPKNEASSACVGCSIHPVLPTGTDRTLHYVLLLDDVTCNHLCSTRTQRARDGEKKNSAAGILFTHHARTQDVLQLKPLRATRVGRKVRSKCYNGAQNRDGEAACGAWCLRWQTAQRASKRGPRTL